MRNSGMLTGGLTVFGRSRCIASETRRDSRHSAEDQYWQNLDARADACAAVRETERHVNQLLHSGAGDLTANNDHAVASITQ